MGTTDKLLVHEPMHAVYKNADTFQRFLPAIRLTGSLLLSVQIPVPNFDTNLQLYSSVVNCPMNQELKPNVVVEWLTLLLRILEISGSNFGPKTPRRMPA
jgi:hypothetical protein